MNDYIIREAVPSEHKPLGKLMVSVYAQLEGFPKLEEQPAYYQTLENVGQLTQKPGVQLLVAVTPGEKIIGGVVYYSQTKYYGIDILDTDFPNTSGIRLLAVDSSCRKMGIGKNLTKECLGIAKEKNHTQVILHTTNAMKVAWGLYDRMGFKRFPKIDFVMNGFPVFGFNLLL